MAKARKRKRARDKASPDLTPMIDVTFQLLIFFILCTRFKVEERNHRADLPLDQGLNTTPSIPKEQVTIYCQWDQATMSNIYVVALANRMRRTVQDSQAKLEELVIFPNDGSSVILSKKKLYAQIFHSLVKSVESQITRSGAKIEKLEISFAVDAAAGAKSGTAPWMFVSLAIDAAAQVNKNRAAAQLEELTVAFKFADAQGKFAK